MRAPLHPAKYGEQIMAAMGRLVREEADALGRRPLVLDPFGGVGRIHELRTWADTVAVELEAPWARQRRRGTVRASAFHLPFGAGTFDVVGTSPTYGNRMSDKHRAGSRPKPGKEPDTSVRRSYTHDLRNMTGNPDYTLHPDNTGALPWGIAYRDGEVRALTEVWRVLRPGGLFLLVLSDYFRKRGIKRQVPCVEWHLLRCLAAGWLLEGALPVGSPRYRFGANRDDRVAAEFVLQLRKPDAATEPTLHPEDVAAFVAAHPSAAKPALAAQEVIPCT